VSADLFGGEISSNAADYFASGLKGRYQEIKESDHLALDGVYKMVVPENGSLHEQEVPLRNAMNEVLRDSYISDCERGVERWNNVLENAGIDFRFALPTRRFNRNVGIYAGRHFAPDGTQVSAEEWARRRDEWLPSKADLAYVQSLMVPVHQVGKIANWVAPPAKGIHGRPFEFEYVRLN